MRRLLLVAFLAVMSPCLGLVISCGGSHRSDSTVWVDSATGLKWQVSPTGVKMNWEEAKSHCKSLILGGSSDWRLPTITELRSLIRGCPATQKGGACGVTDSCLNNSSCWKEPCNGCSDKGGPGSDGAYWPPELSDAVSWYWSSSAVPDPGDDAWGVGFSSGYVNDKGRVGHGFARCVR